ncbi:unnamed protein product [Trichogramma brassicae]|uniref:Uncharacterized protein n=1 Tax=Trichogramma brassicae TaxID=86971 RepID=A0A6H5I160_9HYME|nr:unnamed protein product [Trichogramma brassicae]
MLLTADDAIRKQKTRGTKRRVCGGEKEGKVSSSCSCFVSEPIVASRRWTPSAEVAKRKNSSCSGYMCCFVFCCARRRASLPATSTQYNASTRANEKTAKAHICARRSLHSTYTASPIQYSQIFLNKYVGNRIQFNINVIHLSGRNARDGIGVRSLDVSVVYTLTPELEYESTHKYNVCRELTRPRAQLCHQKNSLQTCADLLAVISLAGFPDTRVFADSRMIYTMYAECEGALSQVSYQQQRRQLHVSMAVRSSGQERRPGLHRQEHNLDPETSHRPRRLRRVSLDHYAAGVEGARPGPVGQHSGALRGPREEPHGPALPLPHLQRHAELRGPAQAHPLSRGLRLGPAPGSPGLHPAGRRREQAVHRLRTISHTTGGQLLPGLSAGHGEGRGAPRDSAGGRHQEAA